MILNVSLVQYWTWDHGPRWTMVPMSAVASLIDAMQAYPDVNKS